MTKNKRLIGLRKARLLSQRELGEAVGLSKQQISRIEAGQQQGGVTALKNLAAFFGVSVDYLINTDDEPPSLWANYT